MRRNSKQTKQSFTKASFSLRPETYENFKKSVPKERITATIVEFIEQYIAAQKQTRQNQRR